MLEFDFSDAGAGFVELVLSNQKRRRWQIYIPPTLKQFVIPRTLDYEEMEVVEIIFHESSSMDFDRFRELHALSQYEISPEIYQDYQVTTYSLDQ